MADEVVSKSTLPTLPRPADYEVPSTPFANRADPDWSTYHQLTTSIATLSPLTGRLQEQSVLPEDSPKAPGSAEGHFSTFPAIKTPTSSNVSLDDSTNKRIPRPPNAFMLFRSSLLKHNLIPKDMERRQQNLSRVAGEIWRMLAPGEKEKWQEKAAVKVLEHQARYPNYKFRPSPRGRSKKSKGEDGAERPSWIREIREKYTPFIGPAPPRKKNTPRRSGKTKEPSQPKPAPFVPAPPSPFAAGSAELAQLSQFEPFISPPPSRFVTDGVDSTVYPSTRSSCFASNPIMQAIPPDHPDTFVSTPASSFADGLLFLPESVPLPVSEMNAQQYLPTSLDFASLRDGQLNSSLLQPGSVPAEEKAISTLGYDFNQLTVPNALDNIPSTPSSNMCPTPPDDLMPAFTLESCLSTPSYQINDIFPTHTAPQPAEPSSYQYPFPPELMAAFMDPAHMLVNASDSWLWDGFFGTAGL